MFVFCVLKGGANIWYFQERKNEFSAQKSKISFEFQLDKT